MRVSILFILVSFISLTLSSQTIVSGFVYDAETKEAIIGANIIDIDNVNGTTSNNQAYYSLKTKSNKIKISFIGYQTDTILLKQAKDTIVNIFLKPLAYQIDEVIIQAVSMKPINVQNLNIKEIKNLPSLGAQPDVIKSAQILPGIQSQGEASSMLIVRGGDPGQNMFILDNTPLIYVNHLGGFMSVFNPDIISDITIYKTGFPAKYGGKLSSIFDITQRSGNSKEFNGSFGIGVTDANLSLEGKLSDNMTYIVTGRKTLFDVLMLFASGISDGNDFFLTYGFHDINFKTVWKANSKNTFSINLFQGDDYLNVWNKKSNITQNNSKTKLRNIWGNLMGAASWNCIISPKVFAKTNISYSSYRVSDFQNFTDFDNNQKFKNKFTTKVQDISLNSVFTTNILTNWNLIGGLHFSYLKNNPYDYKVSGNVNSYTVISEEITNSALSLSNKIKLFKIIDTDIGARLGYYFLSDTSEFFFEPRLDLNVNINKTSALNLNFMQVSQASHLMISSGNIYVNEVWLPSSKNVPVSNSKQASVSFTKSVYKNMFNFSVGVYYKELSNLITTEKNIYFLSELENWRESIVTGGTGKVKGLEFMLRKNYGSLTGLISYQYSKSTRNFNAINNGNEYLYEFNCPHDLTVFINKQITDKLSLSLIWNYKTGLPYTPVLGRQVVQNPQTEEYYEAFIYGERNSATMKDYHRLDIGLRYETLSKKRKLKTVWTFSIYNAYNRKNPNFYYFNNNLTDEIHRPENGFAELNLYQMSLFPILPSVSYKVYFGKDAFSKGFSLKNWLYYEGKK